MTADEVQRIRDYQRILMAWALINEVLNRDHGDGKAVMELTNSKEHLRHWLNAEQDALEKEVE